MACSIAYFLAFDGTTSHISVGHPVSNTISLPPPIAMYDSLSTDKGVYSKNGRCRARKHRCKRLIITHRRAVLPYSLWAGCTT
jgi:hypothetical protein